MRKRIARASILVTFNGTAMPGMATCLRKKRILSESTTAFAAIDLRFDQNMKTAREHALFVAGARPPGAHST